MKRIASLSVFLIALIVVGSASAGGSTIVSGYAGKAGGTVGEVIAKHVASKPSSPAKTVHTGSTLPFTGMNLTLVALAAIVLIGLGFALTRASRRDAVK